MRWHSDFGAFAAANLCFTCLLFPLCSVIYLRVCFLIQLWEYQPSVSLDQLSRLIVLHRKIRVVNALGVQLFGFVYDFCRMILTRQYLTYATKCFRHSILLPPTFRYVLPFQMLRQKRRIGCFRSWDLFTVSGKGLSTSVNGRVSS